MRWANTIDAYELICDPSFSFTHLRTFKFDSGITDYQYIEDVSNGIDVGNISSLWILTPHTIEMIECDTVISKELMKFEDGQTVPTMIRA